jgi:hypothetical protein
VAFATEDGAADLRLERHLVVLAAVVADDLVSLRRVLALPGPFRSAFRATLRGGHVALVKHFLFLLREEELLFALNARCFDIRHCSFSFSCNYGLWMSGILTQVHEYK